MTRMRMMIMYRVLYGRMYHCAWAGRGVEVLVWARTHTLLQEMLEMREALNSRPKLHATPCTRNPEHQTLKP